MKELEDIWFKQNSPARRWLDQNVEYEQSFSKTFRTTGGTFSYYENEYVLRQCIISRCNAIAVGSFSTNGGVRITLCETHISILSELQPESTQTAFVVFLKFGIPQLIGFVLSHPLSSMVVETFHRFRSIFNPLL